MSSVGAVTTATDSRESAVSSNEGYRIVLPPLPTGVHALNSVFLHADITARPYRIQDFKKRTRESRCARRNRRVWFIPNEPRVDGDPEDVIGQEKAVERRNL